jgi:hypothetical protein
MKDKFNEEDKKKFIEFLNFVAKEAEFTLKTDRILEYFKLLNYMQSSMLPKIDANILEVKKVIEAKDEIPELPKR